MRDRELIPFHKGMMGGISPSLFEKEGWGEVCLTEIKSKA